MQQLTKEELDNIQSMLNEFNRKKISLGDTVIQQNTLMKEIEELKEQYSKEEEKLIKKYGEDSVINVQTGEIKKQNG